MAWGLTAWREFTAQDHPYRRQTVEPERLPPLPFMECGGLPPLCRYEGSQSGAKAPHSKAAAPLCRLRTAAARRRFAVCRSIRNWLYRRSPPQAGLWHLAFVIRHWPCVRALPARRDRGSAAGLCRLPLAVTRIQAVLCVLSVPSAPSALRSVAVAVQSAMRAPFWARLLEL